MTRLLILACTLLLTCPGPLAASDTGLSPLAAERIRALNQRGEELFAEARARGESEQALADIEGRAQQLLNDWEILIGEFDAEARVFVAYGVFLQQVGQAQEAGPVFTKALALDPENPVANYQAANWMAANGQAAKSIPYYVKATVLAPEVAQFHSDLGTVLARHRREIADAGILSDIVIDRQMLAAFANAARLLPADLGAAFRHAEAYYDLDTPDWPAAAAAWEALRPRVAGQAFLEQTLTLHLANISAKRGHWDEARVLLAQVSDPRLEKSRQSVVEEVRAGAPK